MSTFKTATAALKFKGGSYPSDVEGQFITFPDVTLYTALITISQSKKIVRTDIVGRNGQVREYIGMNDYQVNITGTITGENNVRPTSEILNLKKVLDAPCEIEVECEFLNQFGIFNLIIDSADTPQDAGGVSYQTYNINCSSELPANLIVSNA